MNSPSRCGKHQDGPNHKTRSGVKHPTCVGMSVNVLIGCLREVFEEIGTIPEKGEYVICLEKLD